ncbi:MAG: alpha/beta fold hydrolase [Boseongicola sp.]|nr:alpha/beta fold hydrolase [Boseongicola sp.]
MKKTLRLMSAFLLACSLCGTAFADTFGPLRGTTYGSGGSSVVVFLHGDVSRGGPATYHNAVMREMAQKGVTAIALLRPGYSDGIQTSSGTNHERRDQYTEENNDLVAGALTSIRERHPGKRLVVAGHSGGAAQLGAIVGRYPGLVDSAILIACPCDIKTWRAKWRPFPRSEKQSPIKFASSIGADTRVIAITGADDDNTFPGLAEAYVAKAKAAGTPAEFIELSGADHWNNKLHSAVIDLMTTEATR